MKTLKTFVAIILVFAVSPFSYAQNNTPNQIYQMFPMASMSEMYWIFGLQTKKNKLLWPYTSTEAVLAQAVKKK